jgi:hypothetical protein
MHPVDPCYAKTPFSVRRFFLFSLLFLTLCPGSLLLFIYLGDRPFGFQLASVLCYTAFIVLFTFSHYRDQQRYLFTCPVVRHQRSRLVYRHIAFLAALFGVETLALKLRPRLPESWVVASGRSMPTFVLILFIFSGGLAFAQLLTNRSILNKAHSRKLSVNA